MFELYLERADPQAAQADLEALGVLELGEREILGESTEREGTAATIITVLGIIGGAFEAASKIYEWQEKRRQAQGETARIEKVMIVRPNGDRLLLQNASIEQIQKILDP